MVPEEADKRAALTDFLMRFAFARRPLKTATKVRAGERIRTVDNNVGNVVLYQLSYTRIGTKIPWFWKDPVYRKSVRGLPGERRKIALQIGKYAGRWDGCQFGDREML